jgi:hypothetical protein
MAAHAVGENREADVASEREVGDQGIFLIWALAPA